MENENTAWIIIRAIGVYLAFEALAKVINLGSFLVSINTLYGISGADNELNLNLVKAWVEFGFHSAILILYLFLSYYCLRKGKFIHNLLVFKSEKT